MGIKLRLLIIFLCLSITGQMDSQTTLLETSEAWYKKKEYDSAFYIAKKYLQEINKDVDDSLQFETYLQLIRITQYVNNEEQEDYVITADSIARQDQNWRWLARLYYTKGRVHYLQNDMDLAIPWLLKVDSLSSVHRFKDETVVKAILDRSEISRREFSYETTEIAMALQLQAMAMAKEIKSQELIHSIYLRLADMAGLTGNYANAKQYTDSAFVYFRKTDDVNKVYVAYETYMNYYYAVNQLDSAQQTIEASIAYLITKDHKERLADAYVSYGTFFRKRKKDCAKAIPNYEKAEALYTSSKAEKISRRYMYLMEGMGICYASIGDYKKSSEYYKVTYEVKKELVKKSNIDLTRNLETRYQTQQKEKEIQLLNAEKRLAVAQKKNQKNMLLGGIGFIGLAALFLMFLLRNRQKTNEKLRELDRAKSTFFANISHEFRTPLTLIKGPVEDQLLNPNLSNSQRRNLQVAKSNTQRLESLIEQLLALSKLESGQLQLRVQPGNLPRFLKAQVSAFSFIANEQSIAMSIDVPDEKGVQWFDRDALEKILFNLLGNAVKYTPESGAIALHATLKQNRYEISVINSGDFLSDSDTETIFKRFYQTDPNNPGTGIGLALTKELVELHHGTITVKTDIEGETEFLVTIPVHREAFKTSEILAASMQQVDEVEVSPSEPFELPNNPSSEDIPILLIVDDNADIRNYIASIFEDTYAVQFAADGNEGFEKAMQNIPDIIISDVMMPHTNGYEFTTKIKSNELTSHVPVLLLTAKTDVDSREAGLETGADAFLTKPFNASVLKASVANLLENRRRLQQRFAQEVILTPKEISVSSADEQFLDRLQLVLDTHIQDSQFSIEKFGNEMGVSRMQLHRKLKALTGQSTSEFLRTQRLKIAANLLREGKISVSEVGYTVGFNDPSYFGKSFKKEYGCAPSAYLKSKDVT